MSKQLPVAPPTNRIVAAEPQNDLLWTPRCLNTNTPTAVRALHHIVGDVADDDFTDTAGAYFTLPLDERCRSVSLCFIADKPSDPNDDATGVVHVAGLVRMGRGVAPLPKQFKVVHLGDLALTVGNAVAAAGSGLIADPGNPTFTKWVDTITVTNDGSMYGWRDEGAAVADGASEKAFDHSGFVALLCAADIGTLAGLRVGWREW